MSIRVLVLCLVTVATLGASPAAAQTASVTGAQIIWYGVYTAEEMKKETDSGTGTGTVRPAKTPSRRP
jgi:hypothetical protein